MKKFRIRITGLAIAIILVIGATSCGGSGSNPPSATTAAATAAAETAAAATTAAETAAAETTAAETAAAETAAAETTAAEEPLTPITFTIYFGGADPGTWPEDPIHKYIREKLGVDVKKLYTANDTATQLNLWLAAGDYPDAICQKNGSDVTNYIAGDHIVDLTDYYPKYLPRLMQMMEKYKNPRLYKLDIPGHSDQFWYIPRQLGSETYPNISPTVGVRFDIWKKVGESTGTMPKPKDLEEYYQFLKQMMEVAPTSEDGKKCYAISSWMADTWGGQWVLWGLTRLGGSYQWTGAATAADSYQLKYCFDSDVWMYAMHFLNRAYRDGIADPEAVTMNQEAYNQKLAQGLVYTTPYSGGWMDGVANTARVAAGHPEQEIVPYTWMKYPGGIAGASDPITGDFDPTGMWKLLITKNCKDPEEVVKRLSWMATEDGIVMQGMGLEGSYWNYDTDGFRKPTDEVLKAYLNDPDFIHKYAVGDGGWDIFCNYFVGLDDKGDSYNLRENKYVTEQQMTDVQKEFIKFMGLNPNVGLEAQAAKAGGMMTDGLWPPYDEGVIGTPLEDVQIQLNTMESEYIGKLYVAKTDAEFDALVAEWKTKCDNIGYMDYYNQVNPKRKAAYEAYLASQK